jgi:hypothetical protein
VEVASEAHLPLLGEASRASTEREGLGKGRIEKKAC